MDQNPCAGSSIILMNVTAACVSTEKLFVATHSFNAL